MAHDSVAREVDNGCIEKRRIILQFTMDWSNGIVFALLIMLFNTQCSLAVDDVELISRCAFRADASIPHAIHSHRVESQDMLHQQFESEDMRIANFNKHWRHRCYVCNTILLPWTTARSSLLFTCSHGSFIHKTCGNAFYENAKVCLHEDCKHAPLLDPRLRKSELSIFQDLYRPFQPALESPGQCTLCAEPLFANGIQIVLTGYSRAFSCQYGKHYFHRDCIDSLHLKTCLCGDKFVSFAMSMPRTRSALFNLQLKKYFDYYHTLQLFATGRGVPNPVY